MGAGNRYTLEENREILAYQFDISCDCWEHDIYECDCRESELDTLTDVILELPLTKRYGLTDDRRGIYYGEMFEVRLLDNYHGDAIVIDLIYQNDFEQYGLQQYNYERVYNKIIKHINKTLPLFVGHGYSRSNYSINEIN